MRLFACQRCGTLLYFENTHCGTCGATLGYLPGPDELSALEPAGDAWRPRADPVRTWRFCNNARHGACNWMVPADLPEAFCAACRHNRTVPDLTRPENLLPWRKMEVAKRRLVYTLDRLDLPRPNRAEDPVGGLCFDMLADPDDPDAPRVMTGHDEGVVTLALVEADDAERERRRTQMGEPFRTLLGHFRHEVGHYYWNVLVRDAGRFDAFRAVFGDERADYGEALKAHYAAGPKPDWQSTYISSYAAAHPWEDWAETWAHYLHTVDSLEQAASFGMGMRPELDRTGALRARAGFDPYTAVDIGAIMSAWMPLTLAMNSMNRCMGIADLYPFVLSDAVVGKLGAIHAMVHTEAAGAPRDTRGET